MCHSNSNVLSIVEKDILEIVQIINLSNLIGIV
jgi:hypothetical protein